MTACSIYSRHPQKSQIWQTERCSNHGLCQGLWQGVTLEIGHQTQELRSDRTGQQVDSRLPPSVVTACCVQRGSFRVGLKAQSLVHFCLIYISDLPKEVNATVHLFADDTIMYMTISGPGDSTSFQLDLDRLAAWEEKWKMEFYSQKCSVLHITRSSSPQINRYQLHGHTPKMETDSKYLGITTNSKLSWNNHIGKDCTKANSSIGFLRRNF